mmetsp:Transcript_27583/g.65388  ORF Transcript_27583/g.65388 Transcript_27583/m.65388 type:complete len:86 (+) Transcript_27583:3850-4107(+)
MVRRREEGGGQAGAAGGQREEVSTQAEPHATEAQSKCTQADTSAAEWQVHRLTLSAFIGNQKEVGVFAIQSHTPAFVVRRQHLRR